MRRPTIRGLSRALDVELTAARTALCSLQSAGVARVLDLDLSRYRTDPVSYSREVLRVDWWTKQQQIC